MLFTAHETWRTNGVDKWGISRCLSLSHHCIICGVRLSHTHSLLQRPIQPIDLPQSPFLFINLTSPVLRALVPSQCLGSAQGMAEAPGSPGGGSHESGEHSPPSSVREHDRFLPIANISRIMKKALPANGKIAKDAKETVQECVSEFISFITSEASDKCQREKRKTINGDDLLWAMATLGFEDYIDPLKIYLARYREMEGDTKGSAKCGDGSAKKDGGVVPPGANAQQLVHPGSFSQGVSYQNTQGHQHLMVPTRGRE